MYSEISGENGQNGITWSATNGTGSATINATTGVLTAVSPGTVTVTATYSHSSNTVWTDTHTVTIIPLEDGIYYFKNAEHNLYMQIDDNASNVTNSGEIFELWNLDGANDQRWNITFLNNGYYKITSVASGLAISVPSSKVSNDEATLVQESYTGLNRQQWKITLTSDGTYKFSPRSNALLYLASEYNSLIDEGYNIQQRVNLGSSEDEWNVIRMLPVSGYELEYNPDLWNYDPVQDYTNCYAYALNNQVYPGTNNVLWYMMQPGQAAGYQISKLNLTEDILELYVESDSNVLGFSFEEIDKYEVCDEGTYKVALVIALGDYPDYHWYRQNPDGTWSHKLGDGEVTNLDGDDKIIIDPELADRDYEIRNYSIFVGYYQISPLNNYYGNGEV